MMNILKVLVGSKAHGLDTPQSDADYRSVYILPTEDFFKLGGEQIKLTNWSEGQDDDTSWELGKFLNFAIRSNPSILEVFLAPIVTSSSLGDELRELFPRIWNSNDVKNAFTGYGVNQRKKFLEQKDGKPNKFAAAYARSLYNGLELLKTGTFTVRITDTTFGSTIRRFKEGEYEIGEVIQVCYDLEQKIKKAYENNSDHYVNMDAVNEFLIKVRKENFG